MPDQSPPPHTIVLAIDGLRAAALGAYGAAAYDTPAFDALTAEAVTYNACHADTPDPALLAERLAPLIDLPGGSLFVTDNPAPQQGALAERFGQTARVSLPTPEAPADTIGETTLAVSFARFAEALAERAEGLSGEQRLFAWLETRALTTAWDAPPSLYAPLVDEDDPPVVPTVEPAAARFEKNDSPEACEARFAAGCRYAGQVMALDACLAGWLDVVSGLFEGEAWRLVLLGLRGYPLGEHGVIGPAGGGVYSESTHVPLFVRRDDPASAFTREPRVATLSAALGAELGAAPLADGPVRIESPCGATAVRDGGWMLLRPAAGPETPPGQVSDTPPDELYVKPDDRWEQNDVASLEPEETDRLAELLG